MKDKNGSVERQAGELAGLIENIVYLFGTHGMDGECCESISHGEFRALRAAFHQNSCTMQDIARSAVVTKSGATRIVGRLAEKGLVDRGTAIEDGRICCVSLTKEGKALIGRIEERLKNEMKSVLEEMDPALHEILVISLKEFFRVAQLKNSYAGKQAEDEHSVC